MRVLVVGNGGREHAMAWKIAQSPNVSQVFVAPGNGGTETEKKVKNIAIASTDITALIDFAKNNQVGLTIVGPEAPLVLGITDAFEQAGLLCFGPSQRGAELEGSKAFTKDFLARYQIPTAAYATFTETAPALVYAQQQTFPVVIKADGLAAGKGVVIAETYEQAQKTIQEMLDERSFGDASGRIVIEDFLFGEETSFIVITDGDTVIPLATSQDHKRRDDHDLGPNTGGMGAYSPAPLVTPLLEARIMQEVIYPTLAGLKKDQRPYKGFLYAGLMINSAGEPKVLEFNCRLGDPETQPILIRLKSDLVDLCLATLEGRLNQTSVEWDLRPAVGVVLAAKGYPDQYAKGEPITHIPDETPTQKVFHAGTQKVGDQICSNGGRVLCATAMGHTIQEAKSAAYELVEKIEWAGKFYRTDISDKAHTLISDKSPPLISDKAQA